MNKRQLPIPPEGATYLITDALEGLRQSTGIAGEILPAGIVSANGARSDGRVVLHVAGKSLQYNCEVKHMVDRFVTLNAVKARSILAADTTILISPPLTSAMAARCQELDIQFIDTAGNAFITDRQGVLISVMGRKLEKELLRASRGSTITPAALRMIFAFLVEPAMLNAPYRDIASTVRVSTGAIGKVFETLEARGFIGTTSAGGRLIRSPELLLKEWASGYLNRLEPKLRTFRFSGPTPTELRKSWSPEFRVSAWGGEVAAEIITGHLKPETIKIYMDMDEPGVLTDLVKRCRLRADPQGVIEVVQPFWNMDKFADAFPTVPLPLVYADLIATHDSRSLQVAEQIFAKVINHVHGS